ncbi:MAG: hypothetical protein ACRDG6_09605 [Candidatus Limnocylindria bacterium]
MRERPRRRRFRSRRPKAEPRPTSSSPAPARGPQRRIEPRSDRRTPGRIPQGRGDRGRRPLRARDELRPGTPCVILLDCREGEPDRTGAAALFEGFFDFETGDPRRSDGGIPRLRLGDERLWGFECWWRVDAARAGLTADDREQLETSKRLLRGLLRDARRSGGFRSLPART